MKPKTRKLGYFSITGLTWRDYDEADQHKGMDLFQQRPLETSVHFKKFISQKTESADGGFPWENKYSWPQTHLNEHSSAAQSSTATPQIQGILLHLRQFFRNSSVIPMKKDSWTLFLLLRLISHVCACGDITGEKKNVLPVLSLYFCYKAYKMSAWIIPLRPEYWRKLLSWERYRTLTQYQRFSIWLGVKPCDLLIIWSVDGRVRNGHFDKRGLLVGTRDGICDGAMVESSNSD